MTNVPDRYAYYADLNCPFCYALHERITEQGAMGLVTWCGIQHLTPAQCEATTDLEIEDAVSRVRCLVPNLSLRVPTVCPDTRDATLAIIQAELENADKAHALRTELYRAFWVEGKDIADARVIAVCARRAGLRYAPPSDAATATAERWQRQWEAGPFDRRVPVLTSPKGAVSVGLDEARRTLSFLRAGILSSFSEQSCRVAPTKQRRPRNALLGRGSSSR